MKRRKKDGVPVLTVSVLPEALSVILMIAVTFTIALPGRMVCFLREQLNTIADIPHGHTLNLLGCHCAIQGGELQISFVFKDSPKS